MKRGKPYENDFLRRTSMFLAYRISDRKSFKGYRYLAKIETLTSKLKNTPEKKTTLNGAAMYGKALADLAKRLVKLMNDDKLWDKLNPHFYQVFEDNICRKCFEKHIKPLLAVMRKTAKEIEAQKDEAIRLFKDCCKMKDWVDKAEREVEEAIETRKEYEKEDSLIWDITKYVGGVVAGAAGGYVLKAYLPAWMMLSDVKLKDNITIVNDSEYEILGLRGVKWIWKKEAEKLGLRGQGTGVVAQDVEQIYPWAVVEGHDGYKRVNYFFLRLMVMAKKWGQQDSLKPWPNEDASCRRFELASRLATNLR